MFWGFMTVYRNVDAYFYLNQNLINSSISTHFGRRTMNNWTVYCHLTVVNSYIQWIQFINMPIDIDTCTYIYVPGLDPEKFQRITVGVHKYEK